MRTVFILVGNELRRFLNDKTALALTFLVPVVLIYIFGNVFGVGRGSSGPSGIPLAVVSQVDSPVTKTITSALEKEKAFKVVTTEKNAAGQEVRLTGPQVREMIRTGKLRFALIFPDDAQSDQHFGLKLKFLNNPRNEIETQTVTGLVQKVIYSSAPQALIASVQKLGQNQVGAETMDEFNHAIANAVGQAFGLDPAQVYENIQKGEIIPPQLTSGGTAGGGSFIENLIGIESEQLGGQVRSPMATRSVGGWAMMFLLFSLTAAATSLFDEKKAGLYQRLLAAPVRRTHILWSKYLFGMLLGLIQLLTLFVAGRLLFGIDITSNLFNLVLICLAASAACVAFGMLLAAIAPSSAAASGLGTFLILTMSAIGGAWFPISFMPGFIQVLSKFTIVYWSIEGFIQVLWANCTTRELLPTLGILLAIAAVVNAVSVWRFNRGQIFD